MPGTNGLCPTYTFNEATNYITGYTYDAAGNRLTKTALQEASPNPVSVLSQFSYDNIYELTQAVVNGSVAEGYSYDAVGNRLTSAGPTSYTYNSLNELTSSSAATYAYDSNGNTISKTTTAGITSYTWDFENRLTSVTLPGTGGTVNFKYDPFGRRIEKIAPTTGTTIYAYDGANVTEELGGVGSLLAYYTQGVGIDEPLAISGAGGTNYYHADGLGSITALTSGSGQLANSYVYDSFGDLTASTRTVTNPFQYTGREFDSETGLFYYRARYYDPTSGRFLGEDPLRFVGGINYYAYVRNNPVKLNDPFGLLTPCSEEKCLQGLNDADKNTNAVDRAEAAWTAIQAAADANGIDPALLAAIGVLESGFINGNENDGAGVGVGVFQITVSGKSGVTAAEAGDITWAAEWAADLLSSNMDYLSAHFPNFTPTQLLQATGFLQSGEEGNKR